MSDVCINYALSASRVQKPVMVSVLWGLVPLMDFILTWNNTGGDVPFVSRHSSRPGVIIISQLAGLVFYIIEWVKLLQHQSAETVCSISLQHVMGRNARVMHVSRVMLSEPRACQFCDNLQIAETY